MHRLRYEFKVVGLFVALYLAPLNPLRAEDFYIETLPKGTNVTLPFPAVTIVPATERVTISSTDMPQTVKISPLHLKKGKVEPFRLAIYDPISPKVKYVTLNPGMTYLYSFKDLGSVSLVPEELAGKKRPRELVHLAFRLESDKPLEIGR